MKNPLDVVHQGHRFAVVDKPAGIGVEAHFDYDTVEARARAQWKREGATKPPFVGIVHRLDRPVSGCLLLALNKSTLVKLNAAFADGRAKKTYRAVTETALPEREGRLKHYIGRSNDRRTAVASTRPLTGGKESVLDYRLLAETDGRFEYEIEPITGRFHQIRVQLATAGAPIVGDVTYGSRIPFMPATIALHASRLSFPDPAREGALVRAEAPCPSYWPS